MALLTTATVKLELSRAKEILEKTNQPRILEFLTKCQDPEKIDRVLIQLATFEREYPGGLENYVSKITKLLKEYVENVTKYDGCELKAPATFHLSWDEDLDIVRQTDLKGTPHLKKCAFFLLAGGLGERMGFDGAKPCMEVDSITHLTYMELYCTYLKEYQALFGNPQRYFST